MEECKARAKLVLLKWKVAVNKKIEKEETKLLKAKEKSRRQSSITSTVTILPGSPITSNIPEIIHPNNNSKPQSPQISSQINYAKRPFLRSSLRKTLSYTPDDDKKIDKMIWISTSNSFQGSVPQHHSTQHSSSFQDSSFQNSSFQNSSFQNSSLGSQHFQHSSFQNSNQNFQNSSFQSGTSCMGTSIQGIQSCFKNNIYQNSSTSLRNSNHLHSNYKSSSFHNSISIHNSPMISPINSNNSEFHETNSNANIYEQSIDKKREAIRQKGEVKNLAKGKNQGFVMKRLSSFSSGTGQNRSFDSNQSDDVQIKVTENSVKSKRERMKNFRFHSVQE